MFISHVQKSDAVKYTHIYVCICICVYVYIRICIYIYMYIYICSLSDFSQYRLLKILNTVPCAIQ